MEVQIIEVRAKWYKRVSRVSDTEQHDTVDKLLLSRHEHKCKILVNMKACESKLTNTKGKKKISKYTCTAKIFQHCTSGKTYIKATLFFLDLSGIYFLYIYFGATVFSGSCKVKWKPPRLCTQKC